MPIKICTPTIAGNAIFSATVPEIASSIATQIEAATTLRAAAIPAANGKRFLEPPNNRCNGCNSHQPVQIPTSPILKIFAPSAVMPPSANKTL